MSWHSNLPVELGIICVHRPHHTQQIGRAAAMGEVIAEQISLLELRYPQPLKLVPFVA